VREVFRVLLVAKVLEGIRPEEVAHRSERRWLFEPVQLKQQVNIDRISSRKLTGRIDSRVARSFERDCPGHRCLAELAATRSTGTILYSDTESSYAIPIAFR
jgi:hypothetical protein